MTRGWVSLKILIEELPSLGRWSVLILTDPLGSVRQVTDPTGAITLVRAYSPYGEATQSLGDFATPYSFTGELTDPSGLVFLRARFYDPATGRFASRDTWQGEYQNPLSLNRWLYGLGNPIIYKDPSGNNPAAILAVVIPPLIGLGAGVAGGAAAGWAFGSCTYEWAIAGECGCDVRQVAISMTKSEWKQMNAVSGGLIAGYSIALAAAIPVGPIILGATLVAVSALDIIPAINTIKSVGVTWCSVTRVLIDVAGLVFGTASIVQGIRTVRAGVPFPGQTQKYPAIRTPINRDGLRIALGPAPEDLVRPQAHHNLPWRFREWFASAGRGLDVNDPTYGRWVEGTPPGSHQTWSMQYEQEWSRFITQNPNATRSQVLTFLEELLNSGEFPGR